MMTGINFELFRQMLRLRRAATAGPWFASPDFEDNNDEPSCSVGTHEGDHYESTIAQFLSGEYDYRANAEFFAFMGTHAEDMCVELEKVKKIIEAMTEAMIKDDFTPLAEIMSEIKAEKGFKVIKPRSPDQISPGGNVKLFLAGSIDNGNAEDWQIRVEEEIKDLAVTVYNPRRDDWNPDLRQDISEPDFNHQVNWELDHIEGSEVVFVYFSPGGPAPVTLMELGSLDGKAKDVVVCCPDGYWRKGNVQVLCHRRNIPVISTLDEAIPHLRYILGNALNKG